MFVQASSAERTCRAALAVLDSTHETMQGLASTTHQSCQVGGLSQRPHDGMSESVQDYSRADPVPASLSGHACSLCLGDQQQVCCSSAAAVIVAGWEGRKLRYCMDSGSPVSSHCTVLEGRLPGTD